MRPVSELEQGRGTVTPGVASVETADDAADFECGIDVIRSAWVNRQAHHAPRKRHAHRPGSRHDGQSPPALPPIITAIDRWWSCPKVQNLGIVGVKDNCPHHFSLIWKREAFPIFPPVGAAIRTVLRTSIDNLRIVGMDSDRTYFNFV